MTKPLISHPKNPVLDPRTLAGRVVEVTVGAFSGLAVTMASGSSMIEPDGEPGVEVMVALG